MSKVAIVGAGMGGLATALRLAHLGHQVEVFEKTDQVGGRNRSLVVGHSTFDAGPTLLMMLEPFRRLFNEVGEQLESHLKLVKCEPSYRVFYSDQSRIDAYADPALMASEIERFAGLAELEGFLRLLRELRALYEDAIPNFVERNFYSPLDFFGPRQLALVRKHKMLSKYSTRIGEYVRDPRLRMLCSFQTMYLGLSPFQAPWVYAVLTHMEYDEGIWYPEGGIAQMSKKVADLARARGANIHLDTPVRRIESKGVELQSGERIGVDAVVCNADLPYAREHLEGIRDRKWANSCSALVLYLDYAGELPELLHHNVFFSKDFRANLDDIFVHQRIPQDPSFYACISSKTDSSQAAPGHHNLMLLIPCPNLSHPWSEADHQKLRQAALDRLKSECRFDPQQIRAEASMSPEDWRSILNLYQGAAFGLSHHFLQSAWFRPRNYSRGNPGLYYVGASTIPGNGLPMVLISAELVVERMRRNGSI